eukprot:g39434.t1
MKEFVIDFRKQKGGHIPIYINDAEVEMVENVKFLGMTITNTDVDAMVKKAQQCLYFLSSLRKLGMSMKTLTNLYGCTTESFLTRCITTWYGNCSAQDHTKQQRVVKTAQSI